MKKILLLLLLAGMFLLNGCAVYKATTQPDKKDLNVLTVGTHRDLVRAELGAPAVSDQDEGGEYDIFSFVQGYTKGAKVGRALTHGILDVFTLGLWEVIGTPIEGAASGKKMLIKVIYKDKKVVRVEPLEIPTAQSPTAPTD